MAKKEKLSLSPEELLEQALVKEEEQPYAVPGNWVWTRLASLVNIHRGVSFTKNDAKLKKENTTCLILRGGNINDGKLIFDDNIYVSKSLVKEVQLLKKNDIIIVASTGSTKVIGKAAISEENYADVAFGAFITLVRVKEDLNQKFVAFYFLSEMYRSLIRKYAKGVNINNIKNEHILFMPFVLPPLPEQQRIVAVIESLFEKLNRAKELAQTALDSFENRKSAILHKAFTGELTRKWREENTSEHNKLLEVILEFYTNSSKLKDISIIKEFQGKASVLKNIKNSKWYKCHIGAIGIVCNGSTPSRKVLKYWGGEISWVSSGEVRNNVINYTNEKITTEGYNASSVRMLNKGSILIAMIGEGKTRGQTAILNIDATINQNIAAIDLSHKCVISKFVWYWLQYQYENNRQVGNGSGPKALNCHKIRNLDFILPPLLEQQEIVRILDNLLENEQKAKDLCDVIDKIDHMKKSILARAFRGELGTNNPAEESALGLLKEVLKAKA
ncbi:type I restriction enzyme S subunit [Anaerospora hongkongensis]|uniref:Type I restriction enzyme S subunit n=1 Tax=Anaerospora hongkongensis TaxID=244830 RepID=A0A4R1Q0G5_9FIRM|nr:restriction endonuclease subunit S [Anaerospora hongkongensis]TCL36803.1 type I restriction enzyme S subunit [Anaerospora hongkongensis]